MSRSSSDSGVENSKILPLLIEPIETRAAKFHKPRLNPSVSGSITADAFALDLDADLGAFYGGFLRFWRNGFSHREERSAGFPTHCEGRLGNFIHRVALDQAIAIDAMHGAASRVKQAQVVVSPGGRYG